MRFTGFTASRVVRLTIVGLTLAAGFGLAQSFRPGQSLQMMPGMMPGPVSGEFQFLSRMIPHHEEAITTAKIVADRTTRVELRVFARRIVTTQTAEVTQMRSWLAQWYADQNPVVTYRPMMRDLTRLTGDTLDRVFLEDMIPHHRMAVMMSQRLLMTNQNVHREVATLARTIRTVQTNEIRTMSRWLEAWFGTGLPIGLMGSGTGCPMM